MMIKCFSTVLFVLVCLTSVHAKSVNSESKKLSHCETDVPELEIETPIAVGSGCPEGTVGVSLTPDKKTVSFIFDSFVSESGDSVERQRDRKKCVITLPLQIPKGWQVSVVKIEQRGFFSVPEKASAQIKTTYSMRDARHRLLQRSITKNKNIRGPAEEEFTIAAQIKNVPVFSQCGKKINFRIDTEVETKSNREGENVLFAVDSLDAAASSKGQHVHFLWRRCK